MDAYIGMISAFGFSWAPANWAICSGQQFQIAQYSALYSLLGTYFGGDGRVTFGLPDLRGRHAIGWGGGPGLASYSMGQAGGNETSLLTATQVPVASHTHTATFTPTGGGPTVTASLPVSTETPATTAPLLANGETAYMANAAVGTNLKGLYTKTAPALGATANLPANVSVSGGGGTVSVAPASQPAQTGVDLRNPFLAINFCIALQGIYPARN